MNMGVGITDELIRYLDSSKKIFVTFGAHENLSMRPLTQNPDLIPKLIAAPKFRLPLNGRIYRPEEDYKENSRGKYNMYGTGVELDMIRYLPYEQFILEYEVRGLDRWFTNDMQAVIHNLSPQDIRNATPQKVVVMCERYRIAEKTPQSTANELAGIAFKVFEYREHGIDVDGMTIPKGWATISVIALTDHSAQRISAGYGGDKYKLRLEFANGSWSSREGELNCMSTVWMELDAILQFCVAINAKHGIKKKELQSRKAMTIKGRRLGYSYHVLDIDPAYIVPETTRDPDTPLGHHASPRFHLRRAHIRRLSPERTTFVRQCAVGSPVRGVVDKDYRIKEASHD